MNGVCPFILIADDGDVENDRDMSNNRDAKTNNTANKDHAAKLVDDKRKHLERRLSAAQRDALLMNEAKEDRAERREFREMLKASNESFITALNNMSESMRAIGECIAKTTTWYQHAPFQPAYYNLPQLPPRQLPGSTNEFIDLQPANTTFYHTEGHN